MAENEKTVRPEKQAIVAEIRQRLDNAKCAILVDFKGMSVDDSAAIRSKLRECDAEMFIAKNRLIQIAVNDTDYGDSWKDSLNYATALVAGSGDPVATAKAVNSYYEENDVLEVKCGMLNGAGLTGQEVKDLASLPSKHELQGKLVATLAAPMRQVASVLEQKKASIVYVLKAIQDKKEAA